MKFIAPLKIIIFSTCFAVCLVRGATAASSYTPPAAGSACTGTATSTLWLGHGADVYGTRPATTTECTYGGTSTISITTYYQKAACVAGKLDYIGAPLPDTQPWSWTKPVCNPESSVVAPAAQTSIWFAPRDYISYPGYPGTPNFMGLFQTGAAWPQAAANTQVFKLIEIFLVNATDNDLKTIFANLKQRHIALAIEAGMLTDPTMCAAGVEGYRCTTIGDTLARIKALGGSLDYVAMDEPLFFGHFTPTAGVVHQSFQDLATNIATNVAAVHQYFPAAQIGDIEPIIGSQAPADYVQEIAEFATAYNTAVGRPLDFFDADVNWTGQGWQTQLQQIRAWTQTVHMPLGIIYNGNYNDTVATQWVTDAAQNYAQVEQTLAVIPDQAIIQTWNTVPNSVLPETQSGTMANLVDLYTQFEKKLGKTVMVTAPATTSP